jgi:hypothetical protein
MGIKRTLLKSSPWQFAIGGGDSYCALPKMVTLLLPPSPPPPQPASAASAITQSDGSLAETGGTVCTWHGVASDFCDNFKDGPLRQKKTGARR